MSQFLQTLCQTCNSCENLITLDPGPEQCDECAAEEEKELLLEQQEEIQQQQQQQHHKRDAIRHEVLKKTFKYETESDSSNSDRPLKYTIKRVKNEYKFDHDNDLTIGVSDIESTDQEENVTSTTAATITTTTTTTTSTTTTTGNSTSHTFTGSAVQTSGDSKMPPSGPPQEWSVEDVIRFISDNDSSLSVHAELFRKHVRIFQIYSFFTHRKQSNLLVFFSIFNRKSMEKHCCF